MITIQFHFQNQILHYRQSNYTEREYRVLEYV